MPELPEVETIRRDLMKVLAGACVRTVHVGDRRLLSKAEEARWQSILPGRRWHDFKRYGKYLLVSLEDGWRLVFHLRMTGQLLLDSSQGIGLCRLRLQFDSDIQLSFYDQRRFGEARLLSPGENRYSAAPLGPDALIDLSADSLMNALRGGKLAVHSALLDQRRLAGVGNIYAQEALYKAGIRPTRRAGRLTREQSDRLFDCLQTTLRDALKLRGTSSRNYRDAQGQSGAAQTLHAVYGKDGNPCPRCQSLLRVTRLSGRSAVYCPQCQS